MTNRFTNEATNNERNNYENKKDNAVNTDPSKHGSPSNNAQSSNNPSNNGQSGNTATNHNTPSSNANAPFGNTPTNNNTQSSNAEEEVAKELINFLTEDCQLIEKALKTSTSQYTMNKHIIENNKLLSTTSFTTFDIKQQIRKNLYRLGYDNPSNSQLEIIPLIKEGKSLAFRSNSGTGKTISFVVGTLENVTPGGSNAGVSTSTVSSAHNRTDSNDGTNSNAYNRTDNADGTNSNAHNRTASTSYNNTDSNAYNRTYDMADAGCLQVLCITPTMELNKQNKGVFEKISEGLGITVHEAKRGERINFISSEILIGSPGAVFNALRNTRIKAINTLIIDEADACLNPEGMGTQTRRILDMVRFKQYLFFSATYDRLIMDMIGRYVPDIIDLTSGEPDGAAGAGSTDAVRKSIPEEIRFYSLRVEKREKPDSLLSLYNLLPIGQSIIFVNTKKMAETLTRRFQDDLNKVSILHGDYTVDERENILAHFKSGKSKILVTTDVFSRGIDVPQVNLVINFDLPVYNNKINYSTYIHRIGRCGRFGRKGFVIDFVCGPCDAEVMRMIEREVGVCSREVSVEGLMKAGGASDVSDWLV